MIILPAIFEAENKKKENTPALLVELEVSDLSGIATTQEDWKANTGENNVEYTSPISKLWIVDSDSDKVYNVELDGTLISSFSTTLVGATVNQGIGLTYDAGTDTLWLLDITTDKIYNIKKNGTKISEWNVLPYGTLTRGLDIDPLGLFWICSDTNNIIYRLELNATYGVLLAGYIFCSWYDSSSVEPSGITYDYSNNTLWVCDITTDKVYNINISGSLISSFATSVFDASAILPHGITYDKGTNTLWICDYSTDKIYNISKTGTLISSFATSVFDASSTLPTDITLEPKFSRVRDGSVLSAPLRYLWGASFSSDKIYNFSPSGSLIASFATTIFDASALNVVGVAYDYNGNTLWVIDQGTDKIYNISATGSLISSFATSVFDVSANTCQGIAYAPDGTLWVTDNNTDTIYNITQTGVLISSILSTDVDASATSPVGIDYDRYDGTIWFSDNNTGKFYNIETDGTLISSFASTTVGAGYTVAASISVSSDGTLWGISQAEDKIYNFTKLGVSIGSFTYVTIEAGLTDMQGISNFDKFYDSGSITVKLDLGSIPTINGEWKMNHKFTQEKTLVLTGTANDKVYHTKQDGTLILDYPTSEFDVSAVTCQGIAYAPDGTLWIVDNTTNKVYNISNDGDLISSFLTSVFDASATDIRGITFDFSDNSLWVVDANTDKVYNISLTGTLASSFLTSVFDASATIPEDIDYGSNDTLWIVDSNTDKVYNVSVTGTLISFFVTSIFDASATVPTGIGHDFDTDTLWIVDSNTDKVYNIKESGTLISSFATSVIASGITNPTGIAVRLGYRINYLAYGSATGAFAGEETKIGYIKDGDTITNLFRYYEVTAYLHPSLLLNVSSELHSIEASFIDYKQITDIRNLGLNRYVEGVKSVNTTIDFFNASDIGKNSITLSSSDEIKTYFSVPRKNYTVKIKHGFREMSTTDFIPYYYGAISNVRLGTNEKFVVDIDDYSTSWNVPVPNKWQNTADDVEWVNIHPIDVILELLQVYAGIRDSRILFSFFDAVKAALPGWAVSRKITKQSISAATLIDELRQLMSCFFIPQPDGRIKIKRYDSTEASIITISDSDLIITPGFSYNAQYDKLINHQIIYYGWNGVDDNLDSYAAIENYPNQTSISTWKEEKFKVVKDKWTLSTNSAQVVDRRTIIDGVYGDAPAELSGIISRRLIYAEVGDILGVTQDRYPNVSGITNKKFLIIDKNYNYRASNIPVKLLEV